ARGKGGSVWVVDGGVKGGRWGSASKIRYLLKRALPAGQDAGRREAGEYTRSPTSNRPGRRSHLSSFCGEPWRPKESGRGFSSRPRRLSPTRILPAHRTRRQNDAYLAETKLRSFV